MSDYLILVQAEATKDGKYDHWEDNTGEQYQYPNGYVNKIQSGKSFIYYKTRLRKGGGSGEAGYFGYGVIGEVWFDETTNDLPKKNHHWYCELLNYCEFRSLLPARKDGKSLYENITHNQGWGISVREISEKQFQSILQDAKIAIKTEADYKDDDYEVNSKNPIKSDEPLFVLKAKHANTGGKTGGYYSRSTEAKVIGDLAEEIVFNKILRKQKNEGLISDLKNVASDNVGYDLEYKDSNGTLIGVEVKGTKMKKFHNIKITRNEWEKAKKLKDNYHLYVVTDCKSKSPRYDIIKNPVDYIDKGKASLTPIDYKFEFNSENI